MHFSPLRYFTDEGELELAHRHESQDVIEKPPNPDISSCDICIQQNTESRCIRTSESSTTEDGKFVKPDSTYMTSLVYVKGPLYVMCLERRNRDAAIARKYRGRQGNLMVSKLVLI
jgi:hypothetical protein